MNEKMNEMLRKIRASATIAGEFAAKTAESAGKKASELYGVSKINLRIFDLNTDIDVLYKDVGRIIYASHRNQETSTEELESRLAELDDKTEKIEELKAELTKLKNTRTCQNCGEVFDKQGSFCPGCGARYREEEEVKEEEL